MPDRPHPPAFTVHAQFQHTYEGFFWETGFWLKIDTSDMPLYGDFLTVLAAAAVSWVTHVQPLLSTLDTFLGVDGVIYGNYPEAFDGFAGSGVLGDNDHSDASSLAAVISWPIARHHRGGHPRNYIGGLGDDMAATVATLDSGVVSLFSGAFADLKGGLETAFSDLGGDAKLGVVSFRNDNAWRDAAVFFPYLGDPVCRSTYGTQRRRLRG